MFVLKIIIDVVLVITSLCLVLLILLHKGQGGGLSDMFGGGLSTGSGASAVAEKNLDIITVIIAIIWLICVVALGLMMRFGV